MKEAKRCDLRAGQHPGSNFRRNPKIVAISRILALSAFGSPRRISSKTSFTVLRRVQDDVGNKDPVSDGAEDTLLERKARDPKVTLLTRHLELDLGQPRASPVQAPI